MRPNSSLKVYPRLDTEFKKKDSLDFQRTQGNVYKQRPTGNHIQGFLWIACLIIGATMGTLAFLLDFIVDHLMVLRWEITQAAMGASWVAALLVLVVFSMGLIIISSFLTVYVAPTATGSGVAEAMGLLNGVSYPNYISIKTLLVKFFGLAFAVAAGICGGKEGPLIHMGSIVGFAIPYLNVTGLFKYFRNDTEKRKLMAAGIAAGVSAAFGAPIGGSLFAYEMSKPNTFWSFSLTWKVFFSASISTFVLTILKQVYDGEPHIKLINSGNIKLAAIEDEIYMDALFAAGIIGILGGAVGSLFIRVNTLVNIVRKKVLTTKFIKVMEACLLIAITLTCFFFSAMIQNHCVDKINSNGTLDRIFELGIDVKQFNCPDS